MIEIRQLSKHYKNGSNEVHAVNDLNINIKKGEILALSVLAVQEKAPSSAC